MTVLQERDATHRTTFAVLDADVHPSVGIAHPAIVPRLPERWRSYARELGGLRAKYTGGDRPRHREFASRWDAEPPGGGEPANNPAFAREQLLDRYDMSAGMLNPIGFFGSGSKYQPAELSAAYSRAQNEYLAEDWLTDDPRWYASITLPYEHPDRAVDEIVFCKEQSGELGDRWRQIMLAPDNIRPAGHQAYWPIYEACVQYGLPVGFHVLASHRVTPSGPANYYFEEHCDFALFNFPLVSSMIFEGVFDRFPDLKVSLTELSWSWAVPLAWRLDHAYRVLGSEVSHLTKLPSEYLRDHFWYTTQPMEEPDVPGHLDEVYEAFESSGMADKLMYSSDYPHWDFDEPAALPSTFSDDQFARILGENASALYGIDLIPGTGVTREG